MTDRDALYRAICANPDEDTPRLAFADFLQEEGGKENAFRAEYIRGAIRLAREDRWSPAWHTAQEAFERVERKIAQRLAQHKLDWVAHLRGRVGAFEIERGFVHHITVHSKRFVTEAEKFFEQDPIRSVRFVSLAAARGTVPVKQLFACPHLARVGKLSLDESQLTDSNLAVIGASPHLRKLQAISLTGFQKFSPIRLVVLLQELPAVSELQMEQSGRFNDHFAATLAGSPAFAKLTSLNLREHGLSPGGVAVILTSKHAKNLRELNLAIMDIYDPDTGEPTDTPRYSKKD